jgi:hypothetical protein
MNNAKIINILKKKKRASKPSAGYKINNRFDEKVDAFILRNERSYYDENLPNSNDSTLSIHIS